jgi:phospholipid/cholesterol/gamma-HCH transport system substrate-binding protein
MITRFVRNQLIIFTIASVVGVVLMGLHYMQLPTLLGVGKITVTMELPSGGGIYRFSNVTYRGVQVGKVTDVRATAQGAVATLSLDTSPRIPANLHADVASVSAIGEQYVNLQPSNASGPFLTNGSVITTANVSVPQQIGPVLDQTSKLVASIPKDKLGDLLDESFKAFNGSGYDIGSLLDSTTKLSSDLNRVSGQTRGLIDDSGPLLDGQAQTADSLRQWARNIAGVTDQLVNSDPHLRNILATGPGAFEEASKLLEQLKPTLPVLLANLSSVGQVLVTYHPALEQLLVLFPAFVAAQNSYALPQNNPTGYPMADFTISANDPPPCTVGFLPPSQWRSPADFSDRDAPSDLYCKLPQDSPLAVRGARNYPCIEHPGKRAPTVEMCNSDQPYEPLAMRQHALGAFPFDPNLVEQGVPPDDRIDPGAKLFGPTEGTPMAPAQPPQSTGPADGTAADTPPSNAPGDGAGPAGPQPPDGSAAAAPSGFSSAPRPAAAVVAVPYDPASGAYVTSDGHLERRPALVAGAPKSWKDLLPT